MPYLIDSDWVIDHLDNVPEALELLDRLASDGIAISIISYIEAYQGVERSLDPDQAEVKFQAFVDSVLVLPISPAVAKRCARLREELRRRSRRVNSRALDLIIAATALEHDLILVTRNVEDFQDIPYLHIYQPS